LNYLKRLLRIRIPFHLILTLISTGLSFLFILIIALQTFGTTEQYLKKHHAAQDEAEFSQISTLLSEKLGQLETAASLVIHDQTLIDFVRTYDKMDRASVLETENSVDRMLFKLQKVNPNIADILIITDTFSLSTVYSSARPINLDSFSSHFGTPGEEGFFHMPFETGTAADPTNQELEQLAFFCRQTMLDKATPCIVCITATPGFFERTLPDNAPVAILNRNQILYNNTSLDADGLSAAVYTPTDADSGYCTTIEPFALTLYYQTNTLLFKDAIDNYKGILILFGLVICLFAFLFSLVITRPMTKPLVDMVEKLSSITSRESFSIELKHTRYKSKPHIFLYLMSIVFTSSVVFFCISFSYFRPISQDSFTQSAEISFKNALRETENLFDNIYSSSVYLIYEQHMQDLLLEQSREYLPPSISADHEQNRALLDDGKRWFVLPTSLCVYDSDGIVIDTTDTTVFPQTSFAGFQEDVFRWSTLSQGGIDWFSFSMKATSPSTFQLLGYLELRTDEAYIAKSYSMLPSGTYVGYLFDANQTVLSSSDKSAIGNTLPVPKPTQLIFSSPISHTDLSLAVYFDQSLLSEEQANTFRNTIYILVIVALIIILTNYLLSSFFANSFVRLERVLVNGTPNRVDIPFQEQSIIQEIDKTYTAFYTMTSRIETLMNEAIIAEKKTHQMELAKRQAELSLLQAQINPHFLYNSI